MCCVWKIVLQVRSINTKTTSDHISYHTTVWTIRFLQQHDAMQDLYWDDIIQEYFISYHFIVLFLHDSPARLSAAPSLLKAPLWAKHSLAENTINTIDCSFTSLQRVGGNGFMALQENVRRVNEPESRAKFDRVGRPSLKEVSSNPEEVFNKL